MSVRAVTPLTPRPTAPKADRPTASIRYCSLPDLGREGGDKWEIEEEMLADKETKDAEDA